MSEICDGIEKDNEQIEIYRCLLRKFTGWDEPKIAEKVHEGGLEIIFEQL